MLWHLMSVWEKVRWSFTTAIVNANLKEKFYIIVHHFEQLHKTLEQLTKQDGQTPEIVFEATGVYSKGLEKFLQDTHYTYCCLNPIQANEETKSMRRQKTDKSRCA